MTCANWAGAWTRPTLHRRFGRTRPIGARRTSGKSRRPGWSRRFTSENRPVSRCPKRRRVQTAPAQGHDPASSMSLPIRNTTWVSSSEQSGSRGQEPKSVWQTSHTTCADTSSGRAIRTSHNRRRPERHHSKNHERTPANTLSLIAHTKQ